MSGARQEILNFIRSYHEKHGKPPSLRTITESLKNVSKRKFYDVFPEGIADACRQAGVGADQRRIESTKKARKTKEDRPPGPALTLGEAERMREDLEILTLKPQVFRLMRSMGVNHPSEALRQAEALITAMNPWVLNRGVKTAADLIDVLVKERAEAVNAANSLKAESKKHKDDVEEWYQACLEIAKLASGEEYAVKVLKLSLVARVFYVHTINQGLTGSVGDFVNQVVEAYMLDRGFGWREFGSNVSLYRHGQEVGRYDL